MQSYIQNNQWHELKNSFSVLEESSQKAYWTFENLLGWVQSQTGKLEANIQSVDLMPLLDEALGLSSSMLLLKNLTINKKIAARYIMADSYMLETVLRNLITNAIKFSNELGEITIESSYTAADKIKIIIEDKGSGMSDAAIKKLFNPEKLKATSQSISGLGLMICKQFIDSMNGEISVESSLGKGTTFTIILPKGEMPSIYSIETLQQPEALQAMEKSNQSDILPEQLKAVLQPYLPELLSLSVYEASEVKEVMQKIYQIPNLEKEIEIWLSKLNQALYLSDSLAFDKLLDNLK
jgi:anti-sigma regulatory factor (Ser/Thr protein kinase)